MQTKLTLRLDDELIREVKTIAGRRGQPISKIVANYFNALREKPKSNKPQLSSL